MSQLIFEQLLPFGTDDFQPIETRPSSFQKSESAPSFGWSGALWKLGAWHNSCGSSRAQGANWCLRPGTPHLDEETRAYTRSTWLCITHKGTSPAPGRSISGVSEVTETLLAEEGIETSLQSATLYRLRVACDFFLPFSAEACRATLPLFCSQKAAVRWSARLLPVERQSTSGARWRVVACLSGAAAICALLPGHDRIESLWAHMAKQYPPCHTITPLGQVATPDFLLRLASGGETADVARAVLLTLGVWDDPTFTPRRIAGRLPDEARIWNIEDERAKRDLARATVAESA